MQHSELKWLYIALCQPTWTDPSSAMIKHWIVQRNRTTGLLGFGHYLTILAASVMPSLAFDPDYTVQPPSMDEVSLRKGKYISGTSSTGYFVSKTKFQIPSPSLALFSQNRTDWLEKFMFEEGQTSQSQPSQPAMNGQVRPLVPVYNVRPVSSGDPTSTPVFQPSSSTPQSAGFVPRRARLHTPEFIAAQGAPQRYMYGVETLTAQNYQLIDHMRGEVNQYEQNTEGIEEQLYQWRLWNERNQQ